MLGFLGIRKGERKMPEVDLFEERAGGFDQAELSGVFHEKFDELGEGLQPAGLDASAEDEVEAFLVLHAREVFVSFVLVLRDFGFSGFDFDGDVGEETLGEVLLVGEEELAVADFRSEALYVVEAIDDGAHPGDDGEGEDPDGTVGRLDAGIAAALHQVPEMSEAGGDVQVQRFVRDVEIPFRMLDGLPADGAADADEQRLTRGGVNALEPRNTYRVDEGADPQLVAEFVGLDQIREIR